MMATQFQVHQYEDLVPSPGDRDEARRQLSSAVLVGEQQRAERASVIAFCEQHSTSLWRSCLEGHLTASAVVIDVGGQRVLLLHHQKLQRWLQPGGHVDGDGNLARAALREAIEESGLHDLRVVTPAIDIDIHSIPERGDEPQHLHHDVRFCVLASPHANVDLNHESSDFVWVDINQADTAVDSDELRRLIRRGWHVAVQCADQ